MGSTVFDLVCARIREEKTRETLDIPVPGLPGLFIRVARLLDIDKAIQFEAAGTVPTTTAAKVIAQCTVGVFVKETDGTTTGFCAERPDTEDRWPRFGRAVAAMLPNVPDDASAVETVKALFCAGYADPALGTIDMVKALEKIIGFHVIDPKAGPDTALPNG